MPIRKAPLLLALGLPLGSACASGQSVQDARPAVNFDRVLADLSILSNDSMEGRRTGTVGNERARQYIIGAYGEAGLAQYGASFAQPFSFGSDGGSATGVNIVGFVKGTNTPERAIVVSAHYDHLGIRDGVVFNGADDNASGTAALLGIARYFAAHQPRHTMIFLAADAEESGLQGAAAFVANPPLPLATIALNVNLDMVGHSDSVLFAAGTFHYPSLLPVLQEVPKRSGIVLRFGHDTPNLPAADDWTNASDHGAFHAAGIPFVYFGVEDHPDYHKSTDDFDTINTTFYREAVNTILDAVSEFDKKLANHQGDG